MFFPGPKNMVAQNTLRMKIVDRNCIKSSPFFYSPGTHLNFQPQLIRPLRIDVCG